MLQFIVLLEAW